MNVSPTSAPKEHTLQLSNRKILALTGISDVISFDETLVTLLCGEAIMSVEGEIYVEGEDIKIGVLDTDKGVVTLTGRINGFYYVSEEKNTKKGFFSRLAR